MGDEKPEVHEVTGRRRARLNEAATSQATAPEATKDAGQEEQGGEDRNPAWPAQYEGDGWDQVPVQMRP